MQDGQLYSLNPFLEDAETLATYGQIDEQFARKLLMNGLPCLARLHYAKLAHNDIHPGTLLIRDGNPEKLFIAGFSEWSQLSSETALKDCYQFFRTVRRCLGQLELGLKSCWIGNPLLDDLWARSNHAFEMWSHNAQDICVTLDLHLGKLEQWTTIKVSKFVPIRFHYKQTMAWLHVDDIKRYLYLTILAAKDDYSTWRDILRTTQNIKEGLLARKTQGEYIDADSYDHLCDHLKKQHHIALSLESLASQLPSLSVQKGSFTLCVIFQVPYNVRYGIFNVEYLVWIEPLVRGSPRLRHLEPKSLEIRGNKKLQGVYLSADHLTDIAQALELSFDENSIQERTDPAMERYSHPDWYFEAPHESSQIFPVMRSTGEVHLGPEKRISFKNFLETFFPDKAQLDAVVEHDPRWLITTTSPSEIEYSCQGSMDQSEVLGLELNFPPRRQSRLVGHARGPDFPLAIDDGIAAIRTADWLTTETAKRRKVRRGN